MVKTDKMVALTTGMCRDSANPPEPYSSRGGKKKNIAVFKIYSTVFFCYILLFLNIWDITGLN